MTAAETLPASDVVEWVPVSRLKPAPDNPRADLGDLEDLAASIAGVGIVQPLVATKRAGKFLIVAGHRRHAAAVLAGVDQVPVIVRDYSEQDRQEAMLVENLQRRDLSPFEEAAGFAALVELGQSQREIAERVGRTQPHVSKRLKLLELPPKVRARVESGALPIEDALHLAKLTAHPTQLNAVLDKISSNYFYGTVENAVAGALKEIEWARLRAELEKHFAEQQTPLLDVLADQEAGRTSYLRLKAGQAPIGKKWHDGLTVDIAKHEKEPCAAYAISKDGHAVPICTDRSRHEKGGRKPKISAEEAHRRDLAKASKQRRAATAAAVAPKAEAPDEIAWSMVEIALEMALDSSHKLDRDRAAGFLGLDGDDYDYHGENFRAFARESRPRLVATVTALWAAQRESHVGNSHHRWTQRDVAYIDWLRTAVGYEPSPAEETELANAKAGDR